jgi:hypothetical protein
MWSSSQRKNLLLFRNISKRIVPGLIRWHDTRKGKNDMKVGTWKVMSLYGVGEIKSVVRELEK